MSEVQLGLWVTEDDEQDDVAARLPDGVTGPAVRPVNDMTALERALAEALDPGYLLLGPEERVVRRVAGDHRGLVVLADSLTARLVHQCLSSGALARGGYHVVRFEGRSWEARSVLVLDATRRRARRWASLRPIRGGTEQ